MKMLYEAHRGVSSECPENTMRAFFAAYLQKFDMIELDTAITKDKKIVVFHDRTVERLLRCPDGTKIPDAEKLGISDFSFDELQKLDAGIHKAKKYAGEKVPTLCEALSFAANKGLKVKIDNRIAGYGEKELAAVLDDVRKCGAAAEFTCPDVAFAKKIHKAFPDKKIHYDGVVGKEILEELSDIFGKNNFTVWLPVRSSHTEWVKTPFADEENCALVKKYAKLGLWILSSEKELLFAQNVGADIIETAGELKPSNKTNGLFDTHNHTDNSQDAVCRIDELCEKAVEAGLCGVSVTDHCDIEFYGTGEEKKKIISSHECALGAKKDCDGRLSVFAGVELGEGIWNTKAAFEITEMYDYDIILGSLHAVRMKNYESPYSWQDFSVMTKSQIFEFMRIYFDDMVCLIETLDFDVLSHLTCPLRYINGKYGMDFDISPFEEKIEKILGMIIKRRIALEVNASSFDKIGTMPDENIIRRYKEMGGYLITLASDSHVKENVGNHFGKTVEMLKKLGIRQAYYYKDRIPVQYDL